MPKAFRALRGSLSCMDKQCFTTAAGWSSDQRNHPCRPVGSASRNRSTSRSGISGRHLPVPSGNGAHRARRPSGIRPSCLPGLNGAEWQDQNKLACGTTQVRNPRTKKGRGLLRARACPQSGRESVASYLTSMSWARPTGWPFKVTTTVYLPAGHGLALEKVTLVVPASSATTVAACWPATWPSW